MKVAEDVTIVSANYNNGPFLEDYFDSIITSTTWPKQVIICDDGSTDNSRDIIKRYAQKYPWIKGVFFDNNKGVAHATNAALAVTDTKYILRIDPDDILGPNRIEKQVQFMDSNPEVDVLGGNCIYFDSDTNQDMHQSNFPVDEKSIVSLFHKGENGVLNGTTMVKKSCFDKFTYQQEMVWAEDYDLFARMLHDNMKFAAQREALTRVRVHRNSATSNVSFDTIEKAYFLSKKLFNNPKTVRGLRRNYKYLVHYRRYMLETRFFSRYVQLAIAIWYRPDKLINRRIRI